MLFYCYSNQNSHLTCHMFPFSIVLLWNRKRHVPERERSCPGLSCSITCRGISAPLRRPLSIPRQLRSYVGVSRQLGRIQTGRGNPTALENKSGLAQSRCSRNISGTDLNCPSPTTEQTHFPGDLDPSAGGPEKHAFFQLLSPSHIFPLSQTPYQTPTTTGCLQLAGEFVKI